jgi:hypothetical protein
LEGLQLSLPSFAHYPVPATLLSGIPSWLGKMQRCKETGPIPFSNPHHIHQFTMHYTSLYVIISPIVVTITIAIGYYCSHIHAYHSYYPCRLSIHLFLLLLLILFD